MTDKDLRILQGLWVHVILDEKNFESYFSTFDKNNYITILYSTLLLAYKRMLQNSVKRLGKSAGFDLPLYQNKYIHLLLSKIISSKDIEQKTEFQQQYITYLLNLYGKKVTNSKYSFELVPMLGALPSFTKRNGKFNPTGSSFIAAELLKRAKIPFYYGECLSHTVLLIELADKKLVYFDLKKMLCFPVESKVQTLEDGTLFLHLQNVAEGINEFIALLEPEMSIAAILDQFRMFILSLEEPSNLVHKEEHNEFYKDYYQYLQDPKGILSLLQKVEILDTYRIKTSLLKKKVEYLKSRYNMLKKTTHDSIQEEILLFKEMWINVILENQIYQKDFLEVTNDNYKLIAYKTLLKEYSKIRRNWDNNLKENFSSLQKTQEEYLQSLKVEIKNAVDNKKRSEVEFAYLHFITFLHKKPELSNFFKDIYTEVGGNPGYVRESGKINCIGTSLYTATFLSEAGIKWYWGVAAEHAMIIVRLSDKTWVYLDVHSKYCFKIEPRIIKTNYKGFIFELPDNGKYLYRIIGIFPPPAAIANILINLDNVKRLVKNNITIPNISIESISNYYKHYSYILDRIDLQAVALKVEPNFSALCQNDKFKEDVLRARMWY